MAFSTPSVVAAATQARASARSALRSVYERRAEGHPAPTRRGRGGVLYFRPDADPHYIARLLDALERE